MSVYLVTGCRSGIGRATANAAARAGHVVYAGLRDPSDRGGLDASVRAVGLDVTSAPQCEDAVRRVLDEQGRLDVLVNNAGVALAGFLEQIDEDELRDVLEVNLYAPFRLARLALPAMRAQRGGTIVNVSSMSGQMALPAIGAYSTSKFALEGLSEALRHEVAPFGVRVVLVQPGAFRTDIFDRNRRDARRAHAPDNPYRQLGDRFEARFARIVDRQARDPAIAGEAIVRIAGKRSPRLRYTLGFDAALRLAMRRLLPFGLVERGVARLLG